jgi:gluconokinase
VTPHEQSAPDHTAIVVMGVAACGKSTIAEQLANRLGWPVADADDFHSEANVAKMKAGTPLTDVDRMPWLRTIRDWISTQDRDVVVTCSALRRIYRDVLSEAEARVRFVHLHGSRDLLHSRMSAREDHFMPLTLLDSQLATLELLESDEDGVEVSVDGTPEEIVTTALRVLDLPTAP